MSEKNGEIAQKAFDASRGLISGDLAKKEIKEALDQKDRDHEAEINKLQSLLERSKFAVERCLSDKELNDVATRLLKEIMETPFGNQLATPIPADHEALIGVLVGALSKIESDLDDAINGRDPVSDRAMWNEAKEALSHPLVQEYLKRSGK